MIVRELKSKLELLASKYPIVTLTGPRQSGKSTLLRSTFPDYAYVSLENTENRLFAQTDPNGFLATIRCMPGSPISTEIIFRIG